MNEHADEQTAEDAPQRARGGMSGRQWFVLALLVPLVLIGAFVASRALSTDSDDTIPGLQIGEADDVDDVDWFYRIPAGTADRIAAGEKIEIVPAELVVEVGDTIRIVNEDASDHIVGVFFVGAGETVTQRFQSAGVLEDACTVHPSGRFTLRVIDA